MEIVYGFLIVFVFMFGAANFLVLFARYMEWLDSKIDKFRKGR